LFYDNLLLLGLYHLTLNEKKLEQRFVVNRAKLSDARQLNSWKAFYCVEQVARALFAQKLQNLDAVLLQSILCRLAQLADPRKLLKLSTNYESDRVELSRLGNPCRREHERSKIVHYGVEPQS